MARLVRDILGRRITVGSLVAYPVRTGSLTYLHALRVQSLDYKGVRGVIEVGSIRGAKGKVVTLTATNRLVLVQDEPLRPAVARSTSGAQVFHLLQGLCRRISTGELREAA
jgi:hypothetical protein